MRAVPLIRAAVATIGGPAAILAAMLFAAPSWAGELIAEFSGDGDALTRPFRVEENWEISWQAEGRRFELVLKGAEQETPSILADQVEPGSGTTNYVAAGTYRFQIRANGPWRVAVRQK